MHKKTHTWRDPHEKKNVGRLALNSGHGRSGRCMLSTISLKPKQATGPAHLWHPLERAILPLL